MLQRLLFGCMLFLIETRIRNVVSVSMYDIPFLRHMTSYMTCFGQNGQIRMDQRQIWYSGVLGTTWVTKVNYVVIGATTLMLWLLYGFHGSIMSKWEFLRFQAIISWKLD